MTTANVLEMPINTTMFFEAGSHEVTAYLDNDSESRVRANLGSVEDALRNQGFSRVHRLYLVNLAYVVSYSHTHVTLQGGKVLPIGRSYLALFDRAMRDWALVTAGSTH